jgi:hypothetical protein
MKIRNHRACGFCTEFTAKDCPQAAEGIGACKQGNPGADGTTVHATQRPCVLFKRAADLTPREKFVAKHQQLEPA